jgi:hypothetical protein
LDMSHCKIKGGGLIALADGIRHQGMLEQLQLWGNEFSVDAAEVLCEKMVPRLQYVPDFACPHREQISLVMWFPDSRPRSFAARIRLQSSQRGAFISQDVCDACAQPRARACAHAMRWQVSKRNRSRLLEGGWTVSGGVQELSSPAAVGRIDGIVS